MAIRLGVSPQQVLELDERLFRALLIALEDEAKEIKESANRNKRRR